MDNATPNPLDFAAQINQAHGEAIDARTSVRMLGDSTRNQIAGDVGRAQTAMSKANRDVQQKISKVAGRAQGAIDGVVADIGQSISRDIESAIAPLIDLGVELPSARQIAQTKSQLPINERLAPPSRLSTLIPLYSDIGVPEQPIYPFSAPADSAALAGPVPYNPITGLGGPPAQQIQNLPPPQIIDNIGCPPPPPCPPCPPPPSNPCEFTVWTRTCVGTGGTVCYLLPTGQAPIDALDKPSFNVSDPQGKPLCDLWAECQQQQVQILPGCAPPKPMLPGQQIQNIQPPLLPGQCPPGQQIINVNPPPGGGVIINTPPGGSIQNIPSPQITPPSGSIVNIIIGDHPPSGALQNIPTMPGLQGSGILLQAGADCIVGAPWGSPLWCQCAERWRKVFADVGSRLIDAWADQDYNAHGVGALVWGFVTELSTMANPNCKAANIGDALRYYNQNFDLFVEHLRDMYGPLAPTMIGAYAVRSTLELTQSLTGGTKVGSDYACHNKIGVNVLLAGFSSDWGVDLAQHWAYDLGFKLPLMVRLIDQLIDYYVPIERPGIPLGISLFMSGQLDIPQLGCYLQSHGVHPDWAEPMARAERSKPTPFDWIQYWRRDKINDNGLETALRGLGYIIGGEIDVLKEVTTILPPPTDLVRFMLRSIGDPQVVQQFQLEDEFDTLFQGRIKQWAKADGITEEVLRGYHAAHWVVPSPGDLATFWQRYGTARDTPQANALPRKMTAQDYDRALREQGIAPFWRPFFIAAQYTILGRRDLQWGYQFGAITDRGLRDGFLDAGFRPDLVDALIKSTQARAVKYWLADSIVKAYTKNGINLNALKTYLFDQSVPQAIVDSVVERVQIEATELANEQAIKLLEGAYSTGQLSDMQLRLALQQLQLDPDQIDRIVALTKQLKTARPKQIAAQELCKWYGSRLISRDNFRESLVALRYSPNDAELVILQCERDISARELKREQITLKTQAAAERRQLAALNQQERQAQLAKQRAAKALAAQIRAQRQAETALVRETAQEQAATARALAKADATAKTAEREELRVLADMEFIADHWSKLSGLDSGALMSELQGLLISATADGSVTVAELLGAMRRVLVGKPADLPDQLADLVALARLQALVRPEEASATLTSGATPNSAPLPTSPIR